MEVFGFLYTDCIHESAMSTMSLHKSKRSAYKAMNKYLNSRFISAREEQIRYGKDTLFDHVFMHEAWRINTESVLD